ncbi:MAG: FecR family protein [Bacteroidota bacterium]
MKEEEDIKTLLVKYITGQANNEEAIIVKNWVNAHPENEQYFADVYEAWQNSLLLNNNVVDSTKAYKIFLNKTGYTIPVLKSHKKWFAIAAAAIALIVLFTALFKSNTVNTPHLNQLAVMQGKISKVTLTDGTVVWLNSGSILKYGTDFGKTTRTVYLEGEGFFDIAPGKKDVPFIVHTKNYTIRDIGTRFNLKAYPSDPFFETSVVSGEVSIEDKAQKDNTTNRIYIKQKQTLRIWKRSNNTNSLGGFNNTPAKSYNDIQITQFTPDKENKYIGWKDNLLVFDSNTLQDISSVLERRYDVKINISDSTLLNIQYSGNFNNMASISKVLDIIKQNTPISYSKAGNIITITKEK